MKNQLEQRLAALKTEFETGQKMLADLESRQVNLKSTLLRISGATQVLEELLAATRPIGGDGALLREEQSIPSLPME